MLSIRFTQRASVALALLAGGVPLIAGCPDPNGVYDEFAERASKVPVGPPAECGQTVSSVDGEFFFALSAQLSPKKPIVFLAIVTTEPDGLHMSFQPLQADDRTTPIGPSIDVGPFPIDAENRFVAALPLLAVPGAANPITGSDIEAQITLRGSVCADLICGGVEGQVTKPTTIMLDPAKSKFTMARVMTMGAYPEPPTINCEGDLANPK